MFSLSRNISFLTSLIFIACSVALGQASQVNLSIDWKEHKAIEFEGEQFSIPDFTGSELDLGRPVLFYKERIKNSAYSIEMVTYTTVPAVKEDADFFSKIEYKVEDKLVCDYKISTSGSEHYAVVHLFPFVVENGALKRITNIQFSLTKGSVSSYIEKDFVANSVLRPGSGSWYKIAVKNDGIYKLDKDFLESCGINTENLDPAHLHIYGNGEGELPELNSVFRTDDLAKNAIYIHGEADNSFDIGDYVLFYGWGPSRWQANGLTSFDQVKNIYSDVSYYFINLNSNESPSRIDDIPSEDVAATHTVNSYTYFDIHETDLISLVKGGQRWYGELFDTELERTFTFNVPNIVSSTPASFRVAIGTNARSSAGTLQRYSVNGVDLFSSTIPSISVDWIRDARALTMTNPTSSLAFKISITRNSPNVLTYLDRIVLNARRNLVFTGAQFNFRDFNSVAIGNVSEFQVSSFPAAGFIWDVTNRQNPKKILGSLVSGVFQFRQLTDTLREFVASNGVNFIVPERVGPIDYQNLHALPQAELVIVSPAVFLSQANRLADLHRSEGLTVNVATTEQVYNEFSSGMVDPTAIRMFAKMFYERGLLNPTNRIRNILLFGDGTFDPKNRVPNNNYFVPTYQFEASENHISAMVSDDYFGILNDNESISASDMLDIGVGRLLISDLTTARQQVDKIEHYMKNGSGLFAASGADNCCNQAVGSTTFGDWRLNYVQIADDEEGGYFINNDTEPQYDSVTKYHPEMNCDKLYTDAFMQVTSAGGQRYPDVFDAISNRAERGALVMNYVGHGGEVGLAEERIVTIPQIQSWQNINMMHLFVSATCEFTKYDDPTRVSAGEWVSLNPTGGAIALMTTSRSVYFGVNTLTGRRFFETVFNRDANNQPLELGEILRVTKNASGSSDNKRSFTLIGDPALRLALPEMKIVTDSINGLSPVIEMDTLRALSKVTIKGHLEDYSGNVLSGFNGVLSPSIFDKPKMQNTLGQDPTSPIIPFELQRNIVYKGKATVTNGAFEFTFIVPKDINLSYGQGKISYYGDNGVYDASGADNRFFIGGIDPNGVDDQLGPEIELFLNDELFVNGGITDETPILIAKLFDDNGINTVGNGIGHDLTAIIDANTADPIILNDYYVADMDSYQSGSVRYTMPELEKGKHTLTIKVWDVNNNSSEESVEFIVQEKEDVVLDHVLNYPNPFTTKTEFFFEHNQVCNEMEAQIQILTVSGRLVKTINETVNTQGFRSVGIPWDGKDDFGDQLAKGVYVYRLKVKTADGQLAEKIEKLVLLR